jgi:hypothetical protein
MRPRRKEDDAAWVAVAPEQIAEITNPLAANAVELMDEDVPKFVEMLLLIALPQFRRKDPAYDGPEEPSSQGMRFANTAGRLGYAARVAHCRLIEVDERNPTVELLLQRARLSVPAVEDWFMALSAATELLMDKARNELQEPLTRDLLGHADLGEATDRLGELLVDHLLGETSESLDVTRPELIACWRFGYYLRSCQMSLPAEAEQELIALGDQAT